MWTSAARDNTKAAPSTPRQGYKNRLNFLKFGENRQNRASPNSKTAKLLFTVSKFQKKIKVSKKYVKN
jgi:hypothetical protein